MSLPQELAAPLTTFNHLAFVMAGQSDQILQERLGIGYSQYKLLMVLMEQPHIRQRAIADQLSQTEASISRQIKLLQGMNLVHVTRRPQNKREHIASLTPRGERFAEEANRLLEELGQDLFSVLSDKQLAQLQKIMQTLHSHTCFIH